MSDDTGAPADNRIAYQGQPGANSHIACSEMFPDMEPLPCESFEEAFDSVRDGQARLAMIPVDNTIAGRVADIHHLLPESRLHIVGEYFLPIRFDLMVRRGVKLTDIKSVHSHIHALGQCRKIIRKHRWKATVAGDTAGAARFVAEEGDETLAALAPPLAAELYGLDTLLQNVDDHDDDISFLNSGASLRFYLWNEVLAAFRQRIFITGAFGLVDFDTACINHMERDAVPEGFTLQSVTGGAWNIMDHCHAFAHQAVE